MEWTKQNNSHNHFLRIARGVLEAVAKLRVSWCVAIPLNGSNFVGWVSENYLALARLARWFFSIIPYLRQGPEYKDPERPLPTWSVKELRDWLRVQGLPSVGKKKELSKKVRHYTTLDNVPQILPPRGGSIEDVMLLSNCLGVAIGTVMQRRISCIAIHRGKHFIKRFLSSYHNVDRAMLKEGEKPGWLTSYNFLCLLNIPDLMQWYGPISNLWEGGCAGERYSQELKHRLKGGLKKNWHKNLLDNVLADDSYC
jgi:hypothetical protein